MREWNDTLAHCSSKFSRIIHNPNPNTYCLDCLNVQMIQNQITGQQNNDKSKQPVAMMGFVLPSIKCWKWGIPSCYVVIAISVCWFSSDRKHKQKGRQTLVRFNLTKVKWCFPFHCCYSHIRITSLISTSEHLHHHCHI